MLTHKRFFQVREIIWENKCSYFGVALHEHDLCPAGSLVPDPEKMDAFLLRFALEKDSMMANLQPLLVYHLMLSHPFSLIALVA